MPKKTNAESAGAPAAGAPAAGAPAAAAPAAQPPESFEQAMAELAQLVTQMESGQLPLEASVAAYARGSELVRYCAAQLEKVESQVKVLEGEMLKPFSADGEDDV
jgi:exodeoxyribonuclease VII small subunit